MRVSKGTREGDSFWRQHTMTRIELPATVRQEAGKGSSRRLRAKKLIPSVVYGRDEKPLTIAVDPLALKLAIATPKKLNTILTLKLDSGSERTVLLKDYQTDIVSHALLHADFLDVRLDEKVVVKVPVSYIGMPIGVTEGGILQTMRRELDVQVLPVDIPEKIEVDVAHLKIGGSLHVKDVQFPAGVTAKYATNFAIAAVVAPEKEEVVVAAVEAVAAVAGAPAAGAAPAGGAAPAAGAAAATPAAPAKGGAATKK
jgi:large subunit ribosomal protein L25